MTKIGADTIAQFNVPWWWRTDFTANLRRPGGQADRQRRDRLGQRLGQWPRGRDLVHGHRRLHQIHLQHHGPGRAGTNSLAIEVNPNNPNTMFTLDDVDWTQIPPDNNTGIQFPVQLAVDGALADGNAHVVQNNTANLSSSALTVKTDITNNTTLVPDRHGHRDDHPAGRRHADHGQPERHGPGEHDPDRARSPRRRSRP